MLVLESKMMVISIVKGLAVYPGVRAGEEAQQVCHSKNE